MEGCAEAERNINEAEPLNAQNLSFLANERAELQEPGPHSTAPTAPRWILIRHELIFSISRLRGSIP